MGNLAALAASAAKAAKTDNPPVFDDIFGSVTRGIAKSVSDQVQPLLEPLLNAQNGKIDQIGALITQAVSKALSEQTAVIAAIKKDMASRPDVSSEMVKLQGSLVKALGNIRIPDYSDQLRVLEGKSVDLTPVTKELKSLCERMENEEPSEWYFEVNRDKQGLITSVTATEAE